MFSKSLFKQSCKANGTMWAVITFAVCFMLACVMLIAGNGDIARTKRAIQDTIIEDEVTSQLKKRAINYYITADRALEHFDSVLRPEMELMKTEEKQAEIQAKATEVFNKALERERAAGNPDAAKNALKAMEDYLKGIFAKVYSDALHDLADVYCPAVIKELGYEEDSVEAKEVMGSILGTLNPLSPESTIDNQIYVFDKFYKDLGEEPARYDWQDIVSVTEEERKAYREEYVSKYSVIFLSGNIIQPDNIEAVLQTLSKYGVTMEKFSKAGFTDYNTVRNIGMAALVDFKANFIYRTENMKDGETEQGIIDELTKEITDSLLASLPREVSDALEEIGQTDLYGTLVGSIFFKMAGLLLPIIYVIMTANSLVAGQVDSGSMAYILSSSVKRKTVTFTQAVFLVGSLFVMFCLTSITSVICLAAVNVETTLTYGKLLLINFGAFLVMFAMSGICFLTSCWFNRSKRSMGIGGGLNMFFLVATMLGLFGSPILPSIIRMEALNMFNYVSIISLFDVISVMKGSFAYLWKLAVLAVIGLVCYIVGNEKFIHKDLPL